jgi:hypothetical protein
MDDDNLDRELTELGARWRAQNPGDDFVPADFSDREDASASTPWLMLGAAAAVVLAVVIGTIALTPNAKNSPGPAASTPDVINRLDCARPDERPVRGAPVVPDGAVAARMCGRSGNGGFDTAWPIDTLTGNDAEQLADELNAMPPYDPTADYGCTTRVPFDLVLRYADGRRVWIEGARKCGLVSVQGGQKWNGAATLSDLALRLIGQRRAAHPATNAPVPPQCPLKWSNVADTIGAKPVTAASEVAVTACQYRLDPGSPRFASERATGRLDLQAVVNQPAAMLRTALAGTPTDPCNGQNYALAAVQHLLIVRDRFGDISVVSTEPCWPSTLSGTSRYPSSTLAAEVARLFPQN